MSRAERIEEAANRAYLVLWANLSGLRARGQTISNEEVDAAAALRAALSAPREDAHAPCERCGGTGTLICTTTYCTCAVTYNCPACSGSGKKP